VNVGRRPTFGGSQRHVEAHLLDWSGDLYGQDLEIFFLERLRDERSFPDRAALASQIALDAARAAEIAAEAPRRWRIPGRYLPIEGGGPDDLCAA
jgi:riboflavin kinase/FMN adenylyltransferase